MANGTPGRDGLPGPRGPDGPQGPRGDRGMQGMRGPIGAQGAVGDIGERGLQGDQGPMGPQGPQGDLGDQGPMGPQGPQGEPGLTGKQGAVGPQGPRGERGPIGPMGPMPRHEWRGTSVRFEQEPGVWGDWVNLRGPAAVQSYGLMGVGEATTTVITGGSSGVLQIPSTDLGADGTKMLVPYGESLTIGTPLRLDSSGQAFRAEADVVGSYPCVALALANADSGEHLVLIQGLFRDDDASWTVGGADGTVWLSGTGTLTQTQPDSSDGIVQALGYALTPTVVMFAPSQTYTPSSRSATLGNGTWADLPGSTIPSATLPSELV